MDSHAFAWRSAHRPRGRVRGSGKHHHLTRTGGARDHVRNDERTYTETKACRTGERLRTLPERCTRIRSGVSGHDRGGRLGPRVVVRSWRRCIGRRRGTCRGCWRVACRSARTPFQQIRDFDQRRRVAVEPGQLADRLQLTGELRDGFRLVLGCALTNLGLGRFFVRSIDVPHHSVHEVVASAQAGVATTVGDRRLQNEARSSTGREAHQQADGDEANPTSPETMVH